MTATPPGRLPKLSKIGLAIFILLVLATIGFGWQEYRTTRTFGFAWFLGMLACVAGGYLFFIGRKASSD